MVSTISTRTTVDAVPEFFHYEDTGCEVSLSCLNCPLPQCKYDDPAWFQRYQRLSKDLIVLTAMQSENLTVDEAAERFSVTVRTIFRIMRRCREAPPELEEQELGALAAD
ncbi:MAG: transposase family protein [Dehalococcoidia bacterium]|jgi:hypothetical protein